MKAPHSFSHDPSNLTTIHLGAASSSYRCAGIHIFAAMKGVSARVSRVKCHGPCLSNGHGDPGRSSIRAQAFEHRSQQAAADVIRYCYANGFPCRDDEGARLVGISCYIGSFGQAV